MPDLVIQPARRPLSGSVPVPGDKSIAHRAILFAGLASGTSRITGGSLGEDNHATLSALRAMGAVTTEQHALVVGGDPQTPARGLVVGGDPQTPARGLLVVQGVGLDGLRAPSAPLDCGNSGTTMRLLAGVLAAQRFATELVGDASLSRRPMARVAAPLRLRGARIEGKINPARPGEITAPLRIGPLPAPHVLSTLEYETPVASAQVKSAILISGLWADGPTYVREPVVSRDHTERMLAALGVPLRSVGAMVELDPAGWSGKLPGFEIDVPGDLSAAAFLVVAAHLVPGSRVTVRRVGQNPTRTGLLEILRDMGGAIHAETRGDELGEPVGDLHAEHASLTGVLTGGEVVTRAIDEVPILCALAARARGKTEIRDAAELRVKESDRLATMAGVLRAFGVPVEERPDGLVIEGVPDRPLGAPKEPIQSAGDHRVAMTAAILGLAADGPTRVADVACIGTSFPRFAGTLRALGAEAEVVGA